MNRGILTLAFLLVATFTVAQVQTPQEVCESEGGYWKETPGSCLARGDMDAGQSAIFQELQKVEHEKAQALHTQKEFDSASVTARKASFDTRIAALIAKRDVANGRPASVYQERIDSLTARRDYLDAVGVDPNTGEDFPREVASKLGPVISQLSQDIGELKAELDAGIQ